MKQIAYAKVNIFLKISGRRDNYHEIVSRFMIVKNLFDEIEFIENYPNEFNLIGKFGCPTEKNTIYKGYLKLLKLNPKIEEFFKKYSVKVTKNIPEFAGLGGGSSDVATFLNMSNVYCNLGLSKDKLVQIGCEIGADVPFFVYGYESANVSGIGEVVEKFDEDALDIEVFTPKIECNTAKVFGIFREKFYKELSLEEKNRLFGMKSIDILKELSIEQANDLYLPAITLYPQLSTTYHLSPTTYFSGSGSSFFKVKDL
jgi:4-diphosphocytidyl-2-C-methyl-D-erythritol kinase